MLTTLYSFDPGKITGVSVWEYDDDLHLVCTWHGQIENGLKGLIDFMFDHADPDIIVSEQFVLDGRTPTPDVTPLQIEGALMTYYEDVIFQRNNFKKHVSNELLKQHDLYWKGEPHATDSARHALAFMKVNKHMPTLRKYFSYNEETPGN